MPASSNKATAFRIVSTLKENIKQAIGIKATARSFL
jgi:hypothetical protein